MKKLLVGIAMVTAALFAQAQTTYDSSTLVDTNNNSTSTSTVNSTNTTTSTNTSTVNSTNSNTNVNTNNNINSGTTTVNNNNVNSGTMTYNNNNVTTGDMTNRNINTSTSTNVNTNNNINSGTMTYNNNNVSTSTNNNVNTTTSDNKNTNINTSISDNKNTNVNESTNNNVNQNIQSGEITNNNKNDTTMRVIQPPPTAVAPAMMSGGNTDLCTTGTSGSVQTQIFGVSSGGTVRDMNCERLKLSKTLYDMGMKVAAVATMCQDRRVFDSMLAAGTPCPYEGKIGEQAKIAWLENPDKVPQLDKFKNDDTYTKVGIGSLLGLAVFMLLGF